MAGARRRHRPRYDRREGRGRRRRRPRARRRRRGAAADRHRRRWCRAGRRGCGGRRSAVASRRAVADAGVAGARRRAGRRHQPVHVDRRRRRRRHAAGQHDHVDGPARPRRTTRRSPTGRHGRDVDRRARHAAVRERRHGHVWLDPQRVPRRLRGGRRVRRADGLRSPPGSPVASPRPRTRCSRMLSVDNRTWGSTAYDDELVAAVRRRPGASCRRSCRSASRVAASRRPPPSTSACRTDAVVAGATIDSVTVGGRHGCLDCEPLRADHRHDVGDGHARRPSSGTTCAHGLITAPSPLPDSWFLVAENGIGGKALDVFVNNVVYADDGLGVTAARRRVRARARRRRRRCPPGANGVLFLPWLVGSMAPGFQRRVRGGFVNIGLDTHRRDMARAVLEGVALNAGVAAPPRLRARRRRRTTVDHVRRRRRQLAAVGPDHWPTASASTCAVWPTRAPPTPTARRCWPSPRPATSPSPTCHRCSSPPNSTNPTPTPHRTYARLLAVVHRLPRPNSAVLRPRLNSPEASS